jgi:hypothetical protein
MKKFAVLLTVIGLAAAAPLASANEDGLALMPKADGVELTQYVDEGSAAIRSSDEFYNAGTGGVSPQ